jgi:hypothetical protein
MVQVKLCDFCIVEDSVATWTNRHGTMRIGQTIAICDKHRKSFHELSSTKMLDIIQQAKDKVRFVLSQLKPITQ